MSEQTAKPTKKKSFSKVLKWGTILVGIAVLEAGGIVSAIKIIESRNVEQNIQLKNLLATQQQQSIQLTNLEKLPNSIKANTDKIAENMGTLNVLAENLSTLKNEVGNKKLELLNAQLNNMLHKMEALEESKSQESLVLSLALIIKENSLYKRSITKEAEILKELSYNQSDIQQAVQTILSFKNDLIPTDTEISMQYDKLAMSFIFPTTSDTEALSNSGNKGTVARSIEMIKDTVAGINLDKIVTKKEKKTNEQQLLLNTLGDLIKTHNYNDALTFIEQNQASFYEDLNPDFPKWVEKMKQKERFDRAISRIITAELSAMRQDFSAQYQISKD